MVCYLSLAYVMSCCNCLVFDQSYSVDVVSFQCSSRDLLYYADNNSCFWFTVVIVFCNSSLQSVNSLYNSQLVYLNIPSFSYIVVIRDFIYFIYFYIFSYFYIHYCCCCDYSLLFLVVVVVSLLLMGVIILVLFFFLFMLKMEKLLQLRSPGAKLYCEDIMPCYVINCLVFLYYSYNIFVKLSLSKFDSLSFCLFSPLTLFKFGFMAIDNFCFFRSKCNFLNVFSCYFNLISNV